MALTEATAQDVLRELAYLRAKVDDYERLAYHRRAPRPRRDWKRRSATFLAAALLALVPLSLFAANPFGDLNPGSVHNPNIDAIYNAGVTTGCDPNVAYCPNGVVTREEMASFLARLGGLGSNPPVANARTLQNFNVDAIVRVARGGSGGTITLSTTEYKTVASTSLTAPGPGLALVVATAGVYALGPGCSCVVDLRLYNKTTNAFVSYPRRHVSGSGAADDVSTTMVFTLSSAGEYTFALDAQRNTEFGTANVGAAGGITALFVPFGPTGVQGQP